MDGLIVANAAGKELKELDFDTYDIEVGDEGNSFQITTRRQDYETIPQGARIYIPGTEYGGIFRELDTNTEQDTISPGGLTWRGMMQKKIIVPPAGADYATDSGELNAIIKERVEAAFPGMFIGSTADTGVNIPTYQYERYCTLEQGLKELLKSIGYKLNIEYSQPDKAVIVSAVPIVDYSDNIELSSDMQFNYIMHMQGDGINHLICLGKGELRDRYVYHWYVDNNGEITTTQFYFGADEIAAVYDSPGAEQNDLITKGKEQLQKLMNQNTFDMQIDTIALDVGIGDYVGGRDYLSGMAMKAPISGKVIKWKNGFRTTEYKLADGVDAIIVSYVHITQQPENITGALNAYGYISIVAENATAYQWQYYNPSNEQWSATSYQGAQTDTLRVRFTTTNNTYKWRCIVTGNDRTTITSNAVTAIGS